MGRRAEEEEKRRKKKKEKVIPEMPVEPEGCPEDAAASQSGRMMDENEIRNQR